MRRILVNGVECGCGDVVHVCGSQFEVALQMQIVNMEQPSPQLPAQPSAAPGDIPENDAG